VVGPKIRQTLGAQGSTLVKLDHVLVLGTAKKPITRHLALYGLFNQTRGPW